MLKNVTHAFAEDIDVLLAGPTGANNLVLISDAGNASAATNNVSVTFDDAAAGSLPATGAWAGASVSSKPVNYLGGVGEVDAFAAPAPATSAFTTLAAAFTGANANGTWKLHVVDDGAPDAGQIAGGWCLTIAAPDTTPPVTTITRAPASPTGQGGIYTTDVRLTVAATDVGSGVAETRCVLDPPPAPANFDALPASCPYLGAGADVTSDGAHVLYAASRDATNKEVAVSNAFTIDRAPPAVAIVSAVTSGAGGSTVTWHATENGQFSVRVGGESCATGTEVSSGSYTTAPADAATELGAAQLADGANTIRVCVTDPAGNSGSDAVTFTRTPAAPGGNPPPGSGGTPGGTMPPPGAPPPAAATIGTAFSIVSVKASSKGTVTITVRIPGRGKLALKLTRKVSVKRPGRKSRTITRTYASSNHTLAVAGIAIVPLKPSRGVLRSLRPGKRTKIAVRALFTSSSGAAVTKTRSVMVKLATTTKREA